jgi:hypothetical protein
VHTVYRRVADLPLLPPLFAGVPVHLKCCVCLDAPFGRIEQCSQGHLLCAEATASHDDAGGPESHADEHQPCATRIRRRSAHGGATCPMCRIALPPAENAIRALSAEQGIAALPWAGPDTRPLLNSTTR